MIQFDGFDEAIIGIIEQFGRPNIICYDRAKVIKLLQLQGMDEDEAWEWYGYNTIGSYVGDETPCFLIVNPCDHEGCEGIAVTEDWECLTHASQEAPEPDTPSTTQ